LQGCIAEAGFLEVSPYCTHRSARPQANGAVAWGRVPR
jgi:hypothetical protein